MPSGLPVPHLPHVSLGLAREVMPSAFVIAFLAGIEALLSATVADGMTGRRHRSGQELVGMGIANIVSASLAGFPRPARSRAPRPTSAPGPRRRWREFFMPCSCSSSFWWPGKWLALVPMTALAAVLLMVAWGMSEADRFVALVRTDAGERALLVLTFLSDRLRRPDRRDRRRRHARRAVLHACG